MRILYMILLCVWSYGNDFKINVGVSLAPYAYFVKKIGGEFVEISILVPSQRNPKFYDLTYEQVRQIKNFKLLVGAGVAFEKKWLDRLKQSNPSLRIVTFPNQCKEKICYAWLSITQAENIAKEIAHYLRMIDIKNAQIYKNNLETFLLELSALRAKIQALFGQRQITIIDYGGVWRDFAQEFGLNYLLLQESKGAKWCVIGPFDLKKQIIQTYALSAKQLLEVNPFSQDWQNTLLDFSRQLILREKK